LSSADSLFKSGKLPFLIVLPNEEDTTANPYESPFGPALTGALVGQVDKSYPTCAERGCRAIGGLSRGASWAVYLGLKSWGLFGIIGAHSFPPFFNMDVQLPGMLASIPPDQYPRMYLDIGYSDPYRAPAAAFEELLNHSSIPHEWYLNVGGHDEAYWSAHTPEYLAWYARQFAP
jgi:enterochelin esterase-like enzyme